ncbi:MAG: hypothetical protein RLZZ540_1540 [Bacteroidota bacterium]|jgi:hypothetical protein
MKTLACLLITISFSWPVFAQFNQGSYTQFSISTPLRANLDDADKDSYWFTPNGLSLKVGEGIHFNRTIAVGISSGIDWVASRKLVVVPAFANLKISLKLDNEGFLYVQTAYGKSIILGRGNLHGDYKKISLGFEHIEGIAFFIELTQYGFSLDSPEKVANVSLGISSTWFTKNTDKTQ